MNKTQAVLAAAVLAGSVYLVALSILFAVGVRPVKAEDDCADPTYAVERVPFVGLVCFGESR